MGEIQLCRGYTVQVSVGLQVSNGSFPRFHIRNIIHTWAHCMCCNVALARSSGSSRGQSSIAFNDSIWTPTSHSERHSRQRVGWVPLAATTLGLFKSCGTFWVKEQLVEAIFIDFGSLTRLFWNDVMRNMNGTWNHCVSNPYPSTLLSMY